ncbi:flagellar export chaperone FliS [Novipirellula artificiosorum]|uniref:Flagellar protein FliS n=1 Tax=Novipirellula artificiosorum TaxID=2528016 RepID=A0A5C6DSU8_9BACT|nr:flagellar export chaperone FliS [Novipirellula artificiosorum]TWU40413.1 flagellar protein FliS [Novipirellula artificiosorum]
MTFTTSQPASNFQPSTYQGPRRRKSDEYLDSAIRYASPARLRLMLIERSIDVARLLAENWRTKPETKGPNENSLRLLDLINELLSGVTSKEGVCEKIADLYVFLSKHLIAAERSSDADAIDEIRTILEIEAETWRLVVANEGAAACAEPPTTGLNLEG